MNSKPETAPLDRLIPDPKDKLHEQFHQVARFRQLLLRSEEAYWIHRYLPFWKIRRETGSSCHFLPTTNIIKHENLKARLKNRRGAAAGDFAANFGFQVKSIRHVHHCSNILSAKHFPSHPLTELMGATPPAISKVPLPWPGQPGTDTNHHLCKKRDANRAAVR